VAYIQITTIAGPSVELQCIERRVNFVMRMASINAPIRLDSSLYGINYWGMTLRLMVSILIPSQYPSITAGDEPTPRSPSNSAVCSVWQMEKLKSAVGYSSLD